MNEIIALRGKGNSGKSTTIRILHNFLLQNGYEPIRGNFSSERVDFVAIFSKNGLKIGVTSSGDTYDLVHDRLQEFVNENCNICICACRTFDRVPPGTNAAIIEFVNYGNQFVEKTIDNNNVTQNGTNMRDAQALFSIVETLI